MRGTLFQVVEAVHAESDIGLDEVPGPVLERKRAISCCYWIFTFIFNHV